jgi:hypothetical protein
LIQALLHGLTVMLMVDQKAFDRREMYEACVQLFAPMFKHDAEQVSEPLISKTNDPGTARA